MIKGIIEVIIYVQDMSAQVDFYRNTLGLAISYPQNQADYSKEMWVTFEPSDCVLALHGGGQGRIGKDSPKIVFGVDDIKSTRKALIGRGVQLGEVRSAAPGVWVCDGLDPEGNAFSIESRE